MASTAPVRGSSATTDPARPASSDAAWRWALASSVVNTSLPTGRGLSWPKVEQGADVERVVVERGGLEHGPARGEEHEQREQHHDHPEQAHDRTAHGTGLRARSETSNSSATSTRLATIDDPP